MERLAPIIITFYTFLGGSKTRRHVGQVGRSNRGQPCLSQGCREYYEQSVGIVKLREKTNVPEGGSNNGGGKDKDRKDGRHGINVHDV